MANRIATGSRLTPARLGGSWQDYTPTWGHSSSTAPTLGNGVLLGRYRLESVTCTAVIFLKAGSTTTFGATSGEWTFSLPFTAAALGNSDAGWVGSAYALDVGLTHRAGSTRLFSGSTLMRIYGDNLGTGWRAGVPFTWVSGDYLSAQITYEIAD